MPDRNIDAVCEIVAAFNSGDIERILQFTDPDFEGGVPPELSPEPDTYRGHEGIRRYFESFADAMDDIRFEAERFWEAGDIVVVAMRMTARGRQTAIPVEQRPGQVWTLRDGRAIRIDSFACLADALEAAGLPGSDAGDPKPSRPPASQ